MNKCVVLVYPKILKGRNLQSTMALPLSLLSVGTTALKAGYDVKIIDQRIEPHWEDILAFELEKNPLCVGTTSMTGQQLRNAIEISRFVKERADVPVVWGGAHASLLPEQTLQNDYIDIIVQGEGEATFPELLQALEARKSVQSVKGIWHKESGSIRHTGVRPHIDLNAQPPLAYQLVDVKKSTRMLLGVKHLDFFTSRGCPHRCAFCYNAVFNKMHWRMMEPKLAIRRIKDLVNTYKVEGIFFSDSNFFFDVPRGRAILTGLLQEGIKLDLSHINIDFHTLSRMEDADFTLLKKAGCKYLTIAVESGSRRIKKLLRKPVDPQKLRALNRRLNKYDIAPKYGFMMGVPTETEEDLAESIELAFHLIDENPYSDVSFNIYTPFPGTELFDLTVKHGLRFPQSIEEWTYFNYRNLAQGGPWLTPRMRHLIEVFDFCTFFMSNRQFIKPYEKRNLLISFLGWLYKPFARMRLKHFWDVFPVEMRLAKALGLFARQE